MAKKSAKYLNRRSELKNMELLANQEVVEVVEEVLDTKSDKKQKLEPIKRPLELRDYQIPANEHINANDFTILALAPNGGKTEISIKVLDDFFKVNKNATALVLTHSTNVLKDNFKERLDGLEVGFTYSINYESDAQVHISLPHSEGKLRKHYDFIIVDEAHENYLAERVQRILETTKPKKQLLLTGTPSKFIKNGYADKIFVIASNEISEKYFAKLQIELVSTNLNWYKELNANLELKEGYEISKKDTIETMENVVLKLIERIKNKLTPEQFNSIGFIPKIGKKFKSWAYAYKHIGKTLIICHSIDHANMVNEILNKHGVKSRASHSKNDEGSEEFTKFKNNEYDVLVVVNRARLGYSDVDLFNIIDMGGSHNPDMIYQIFCRVLRGDPSMQKYYLKVTTQEYGMMNFTHACVCAALMLTDKRYLSTFNGDNFKGIMIPYVKLDTERNMKDKKDREEKEHFIFPEFSNDVIDMFKNVIHDLDNPATIYKLTTISEVKAFMAGRTVWTKEKVLESAMGK
jgi:superfamily II DNA or RNA helicase